MSVPAPIDFRQLAALGSVAWRELCWVLPHVGRVVAHWRRVASDIPDPVLRADALATLSAQRFNTEGAALFSTVSAHRSVPLVRLLSTLQIIVDYLDTISERPCADMIANGMQLHRALYDALDPESIPIDYYLHHPWRDDGGYLRALVNECRSDCAALPGYPVVRPVVLEEAARMTVCALNHELDGAKRDALLREWVDREFPELTECSWFEISAASTSSITILGVLSLAGSVATPEDVATTRAAYFPWISLASTMLDSYADWAIDRATGDHSYVSHYPSEQAALERLEQIVEQSVTRARELPLGRRHALISTGMIAMYLSEPGSQISPCTLRGICRRGGGLPRLQMPMLRTWRRVRRLREALAD